MRAKLAMTTVGIAIATLYAIGWTQDSHVKPSPAAGASDRDLVARGEYIVNGVAVCSQCHTPRDYKGDLEHDNWLEGSSLWLESAQPRSDWPQLAPRIAGNPPGTDAELVRLLTTGIGRDNKPLRPPMPQFRMTVEDARAVVAYLRSLGMQK